MWQYRPMVIGASVYPFMEMRLWPSRSTSPKGTYGLNSSPDSAAIWHHRLVEHFDESDSNAGDEGPHGGCPVAGGDERVSAVLPALGIQGAILAGNAPSLPRQRRDIPALENRAGEGCLTAGSPHHLRTPGSAISIRPTWEMR